MNVPDPQRWSQLSPLLDELLDLSAPARPARLAELRDHDPALADELAALLVGAESTRGAQFMGEPADAEAPSLAGQRLGAYTLESPLGQGGTGTVWRARRDDGRFEGAVAIKLLHLSLLGRAGAERFQREGHILARLTHPNIAHLLDAGVTPGGQPYLVIELVRGERFDRHCEMRQLGVEVRLRLFGDVLAAVAHAHSHLVIHRDIKPSNIIVTPDGVVKLLDFGIAKLIEEGSALAESTDLTREWGRALTPEYAAPEQLRGEAVTTATDVYALGVLLYELLTHQLPYPGRRRGQAGAVPAETEPPRPSATVTDAPLRRRLAGDLDTITLRAMKADAAERYPTVNAMQDDLARHLSGHPVLARADSWAYRARKFVGRHRAGCAIVAGVALALLGGAHAQVAVLLALAAGTALALWQASAARAQAAAARDAQRRAEAVKQFIASIFTEATPREGVGGVVTATDLLASAIGRVETELAANPAMAGELGVVIASSCSKLGDLALGARALRAAVPQCERAFGAGHPLTLHGRLLQLEAHNNAGDYDAAEALAGPLVAALRGQLPAQAAMLVEALRETSFVMAKRQNEAASLAPLHEAIAVGEAHLGPLDHETLHTWGLLSNTFTHFSRYSEALNAAERAVQGTRQALGGARPHTLLTQQERWYADALLQNGQPATAELIARQVVADQSALDGTLTPRIVNAMTVHSLALLGMGRVTEAVAVAREVVTLHAQLFAAETLDTAAFAYRLAHCLMPTRRADEIDAELQRDERVWRGLGGDARIVHLRRLRLRAHVCAWRGEWLAAHALLDQADSVEPPDHPQERVRRERVRVLMLRLRGQLDQGIATARQALDRCDVPGLLAPDRAHLHTELGLLLLNRGGANDGNDASEQFARATQAYDLGEVLPKSLPRCDAWLGLGRAHLRAGRGDEARHHFTVAEQCWAEAHAGSVWHAEARHWLAQALSLSPSATDRADAAAMALAAHAVLGASAIPTLRALADAVVPPN